MKLNEKGDWSWDGFIEQFADVVDRYHKLLRQWNRQREATKHRAIADKLLAQADDTDDEDDANASLMVAAPDLLAALERMLAHGERGNLYTARGEDAEVVNQARAAIAKAKGHSG